MTTRPIKLPDGREITYKQADAAVMDYVSSTNHAAFQLYDLTNDGPHNEIRPIDVLSLNALNAFTGSSPMAAMENLWRNKGKVETAVREVSRKPLDDFSEKQLPSEVGRLCEVLDVMLSIELWGHTRVSKLLHRLRPNIAPIWDQFIGKWYAKHKRWPEFIAAVHTDVLGPNRVLLRRIEKKHGIPVLRVWDILLWKLGNEPKRWLNP